MKETWQAKMRKGGDSINSSFEEVHDYDTVLNLLQTKFPPLKDVEEIEELDVLASIKCYRETWKMDEKFSVIIDTTDFGHVVVEVELEIGVETTAQDEKTDEAETIKNMDAEIKTFMQKQAWAFPTQGRVMGKLSAYFEWLATNAENVKRSET